LRRLLRRCRFRFMLLIRVLVRFFDVWSVAELDRRSFAVFGTERGGETASVIRVNLRFVSRARDGDIGKAAVDETSRAVCVDVDENAPRRQPLGAVRRDGVTMIEGTKPPRIEGDDAAILAVELHRNLIAAKFLDGAQLTPHDAKLLVGRRELETVAVGELALCGFEDVDATKPLGIVDDGLSISFLDGDGVLAGVGGEHRGGAAALDAEFLAADGVLNDVAGLVAHGPCAVGSGDVGSVIERLKVWFSDAITPLACSSVRTAWLISCRLRLSGDTMKVFSGLAA